MWKASLFMERGRPALFTDPEDMQAAVDDYFTNTEPREYTITGLALHIGFESRQSFYDYEEHTDFSYIIKKARLKIEHGYELRLMGKNVTGAIFALKNMGWKDKVDTEIRYPDGVALNFNTVPSVKPSYETKGDSQQ